MSGPVAVGTGLSVPGQRAVDDILAVLGEGLVVDAETLHHAGVKLLEDDIVLAHEVVEHPPSGCRLQVDGDASLPAVDRRQEVTGSAIPAPDLPGRVTRRWFELQHLGTDTGT